MDIGSKTGKNKEISCVFQMKFFVGRFLCPYVIIVRVTFIRFVTDGLRRYRTVDRKEIRR